MAEFNPEAHNEPLRAEFKDSDEIRKNFPQAIWGTLRRFIKDKSDCCSRDEDLFERQLDFDNNPTPKMNKI